ncbi:MAG: hypothetical protein J6X45_02005, partial [Lachnospiraceae bacterium]|nr:hypothetical protein [Lachnospiraceae bacterium]
RYENTNNQQSTIVAKIMATMSVTPTTEYITATDKNQNSHTFYKYTMTVPYDSVYINNGEILDATEQPIPLDDEYKGSVTFTVYAINISDKSEEQVVIRVGNSYFVRDCGNSGENNTADFESVSGTNGAALVIIQNYNNKNEIEVFGNFLTANEELMDESSTTLYSCNFGPNGYNEIEYYGGKLVVIKNNNFTGVIVNGQNDIGVIPLEWTSESSYNVAESTGSGNSIVDVYFGFDKIDFEPFMYSDLEVTGISSLETVDIPEGAVNITHQGNKWTAEFMSNYYSTVKFKITYTTDQGSFVRYTTVNRVGLTANSGRSAGNDRSYRIHHGHYEGDYVGLDGNLYSDYDTAASKGSLGGAVVATYYYPAGQANNVANVSLFATITYSDGSSEQKMIESNAFKAENTQSDFGGNTIHNAAMSDFVIWTAENVNTADIDAHRGKIPVAVDLIVVDKVDGNGRYPGAKLGAGNGVHLDIIWD